MQIYIDSSTRSWMIEQLPDGSWLATPQWDYSLTSVSAQSEREAKALANNSHR